jgi:hypothetical protein
LWKGLQNEKNNMHVCSKIEGKEKLLLHELDFFLIKHLGLKKCNATKPRVLINAYYVNTNNANVTNEKLYASIGCDIVANLIEKVGKVEKKKKYVQFVAMWHLFN